MTEQTYPPSISTPPSSIPANNIHRRLALGFSKKKYSLATPEISHP